jgi:hypothetical protein
MIAACSVKNIFGTFLGKRNFCRIGSFPSFFKKLFSLSTNVGNSDAADNNQINKKLPV